MNLTLTPLRVEAFAWLFLCAGLATGIAVETDFGRQWQSPISESPSVPPEFVKPVLTAPYELPPADEFLEVAMRPIFLITRRPPPPPPPPEAPKPTMKRDQFTLTGVTIVPEGKFAFLFEKASNKTRVVAEGKEINGIKILELRSDSVVLGQYDDTEVLVLKTAKGLAGTAPAAATQPRAPATHGTPNEQRPLIGPPPIIPPGSL